MSTYSVVTVIHIAVAVNIYVGDEDHACIWRNPIDTRGQGGTALLELDWIVEGSVTRRAIFLPLFVR